VKESSTSEPFFYRPLFPEARDQGDPFAFEPPSGLGARFRYYVYTTGGATPDGTAFPVYGSDDLVRWQALGDSLRVSGDGSHWAPCVRFVPNCDRPYVMLYSRAIGHGELGHVGHVIHRADSDRPEGPFFDSGHVLTADIDFAIDPDVYVLPNGSLKVAFAMDFVEDEPLGTGIVEADITTDLTHMTSPPRVLARAHFDWHVYDLARSMPWKDIPGVDWSTDTVRWHTIEGPVGGIFNPHFRRVYLYSGGCFFGFYAVGALIEQPDGGLRDVSDGTRHLVIGPNPSKGFYGPGHCSLVRDTTGKDLLLLHARFGAPNSPRQMCLVPLSWDEDGRPVAARQG
jgi:arabinan endo-1,5-alpha-L-arabinosidase